MALPTLAKSWAFQSIEVARNATVMTQCQSLLLAIKQVFKTFSPAWTVWGSSNGATVFGNGDGVDRWASTTNVVWANVGTNHSWIVLQQTGLGAYISIDCTPGTTGYGGLTVKYSKLGFGSANGGVNGTANTAPTALDQVTLSSATWGCTSTANIRQYIHAMQSTDGKCTRIFLTNKCACSALWVFDTAIATDVAWTDPILFSVMAYSPGLQNLYNYGALWTRIGSTSLQLYHSCLTKGTAGTSPLVVDKLELNGSEGWPLYEIPLYCITPNMGGFKGVLQDIWWGNSGRFTGDCYPNDGVRSFVQFDNLVVPWNGTEPIIGSPNW